MEAHQKLDLTPRSSLRGFHIVNVLQHVAPERLGMANELKLLASS
jgi:hypothetical protein